MTDFLSFDANPVFVASFRFMTWSLMLGAGMVAIEHARRAGQSSGLPRKIPASVAIIFFCIGLHQLYYWLRHRWHDDAVLLDILDGGRHVTSLLLVIMSIAAIVYMQTFLRRVCGRHWMSVGIGGIATLWLIGYGDAAWL